MYYGFDIGGSKIALGVFDKSRRLQWEKRVATPKESYEAFLQAVEELVEEADQRFGCQGSVGIGIPGMPETEDGTLYAANVPAASGRRLRADLSERLGRDVRLDNDANCFALSEAWDDEFTQYPLVMGMILGTGVGGGAGAQRKIDYRASLYYRRIRPYPPAGGCAGGGGARFSAYALRLRPAGLH